MATLPSNKLNQIIGFVNLYIEEEVVVATVKNSAKVYDPAAQKEKTVLERTNVTKKQRRVAKSLPILVRHIAATNKSKKKFKAYQDDRDGDEIGRTISEKQFKNWVYNLAIDFYSTTSTDFDTSLVDHTPYEDVLGGGHVLQEGLRSAFYEAIA